MQIQIDAHHMDITQALRDLTEKKLQKLHAHYTNITSVHIRFESQDERHSATGNITIPGHKFHAEAETEDMYKTIDALMSKLKAQLEHHKKR